jgi:hypothetical protein
MLCRSDLYVLQMSSLRVLADLESAVGDHDVDTPLALFSRLDRRGEMGDVGGGVDIA